MKTLSCLLLCAFLSACATAPENTGSDRYWLGANASPTMGDTVSLLYYASYVRNLAPADRDRELERERTAFIRDKSDFRRVQYALCLSSIPEAGANERKLAQQLIDPLFDGGKHDADLVALAGLLNANLQSLMQSQKRGDDLAQKLDALMDIERSLMRREKGKP